MRGTTQARHEKIRDQIDQRVRIHQRRGVRNPLACACEELAKEMNYSERTLRNIWQGSELP